MGYNILVIEDNEQNMYLMQFLLATKGHTVIQSFNGEDGIRHAKELFPDILLLDIQLPGMDGYEIARIIRRTQSLAEIPIIEVTSYAMPGDREKIIAAGATDYIDKPLNPATFIDQIVRFFPK